MKVVASVPVYRRRPFGLIEDILGQTAEAWRVAVVDNWGDLVRLLAAGKSFVLVPDAEVLSVRDDLRELAQGESRRGLGRLIWEAANLGRLVDPRRVYYSVRNLTFLWTKYSKGQREILKPWAQREAKWFLKIFASHALRGNLKGLGLTLKALWDGVRGNLGPKWGL